jgi:hypothetical protein
MSSESHSKGLDWRVESVRLTAFVTAPLSEGKRWAYVVGELPELTTAKPREQSQEERGVFADGQLVLLTQPGRVDWQYLPSPEEISTETRSADLSTMLRKFKPAVDRWLESTPQVKRLAMGVVLLAAVPDRDAGYVALQQYARSLRLAPGAADVVFQVNRPRTSQVIAGLTVNRLTKWSVAKRQRFEVSDNGKVSSTSETYACRLEVDLSTYAERKEEIPYTSLPELWQEFCVLSFEIAEKGETS